MSNDYPDPRPPNVQEGRADIDKSTWERPVLRRLAAKEAQHNDHPGHPLDGGAYPNRCS